MGAQTGRAGYCTASSGQGSVPCRDWRPILAFLDFRGSLDFGRGGATMVEDSGRSPSCVLLQLNRTLACFVLYVLRKNFTKGKIICVCCPRWKWPL